MEERLNQLKAELQNEKQKRRFFKIKKKLF